MKLYVRTDRFQIDEFHFIFSERIDKRITVLKEKQLLEMILSRDFNCIYACSKMKVQVLLDTPEVKTDGISAFRLMDDILGNL